MIDHDRNAAIAEATCDECGFTSYGHGSFRAALEELKDAGWIIRTFEGEDEWHHFCSRDCWNAATPKQPSRTIWKETHAR